MIKPLLNLLIAILYFCNLSAELITKDVFSKVYENRIWGVGSDGFGTSGSGSLPETTCIYRQFLQNFLSTCNINSVVDVGCGDWGFSHMINWDGINYIGYDVVPTVILKNQQRYGASNILFQEGNAVNIDLPCADLLICKDVLQHLPIEDIKALISQFHKFKFCLITNDIASNINAQIERGGYRGVDLTRPPFSLRGIKALTYKTYYEVKQVLLIHKENL